MTHYHGGLPDPRKPEHPRYHESEHIERDLIRPHEGGAWVGGVDLGRNLPPSAIFDQGSLQSCGGCAIARMVRLERGKSTQVSALDCYFLGRNIVGTNLQDVGIKPSDGMFAITTTAPFSERAWPYDSETFDTPSFGRPLSRARPRRILRITHNERDDLRASLGAAHPFIFLMQVFASDYTNTDGVLTMPAGDATGLHIVCGEGFTEDGVIFANSWGPKWGNQGRALMPWQRFETTTSSCWTGRNWR